MPPGESKDRNPSGILGIALKMEKSTKSPIDKYLSQIESASSTPHKDEGLGSFRTQSIPDVTPTEAIKKMLTSNHKNEKPK